MIVEMTSPLYKPVPGLFITATDTEVGKTYVTALIARELHARGHRVGVYKPAASGCVRTGGELLSLDAQTLWEAAGRPGPLDAVCPQRFSAPLAPHLAARQERRCIDPLLLRAGLEYWRACSDIILVEGVGGLMCPLGDREYVADLAYDFGFPLVIVTRNALGSINHTLLTLLAARSFRDGLPVAGLVLNNPPSPLDDPSKATNREEIRAHCRAPLLAEVARDGDGFDTAVPWLELARPRLS
jgi:dethiobiotin synthetase